MPNIDQLCRPEVCSPTLGAGVPPLRCLDSREYPANSSLNISGGMLSAVLCGGAALGDEEQSKNRSNPTPFGSGSTDWLKILKKVSEVPRELRDATHIEVCSSYRGELRQKHQN